MLSVRHTGSAFFATFSLVILFSPRLSPSLPIPGWMGGWMETNFIFVRCQHTSAKFCFWSKPANGALHVTFVQSTGQKKQRRREGESDGGRSSSNNTTDQNCKKGELSRLDVPLNTTKMFEICTKKTCCLSPKTVREKDDALRLCFLQPISRQHSVLAPPQGLNEAAFSGH